MAGHPFCRRDVHCNRDGFFRGRDRPGCRTGAVSAAYHQQRRQLWIASHIAHHSGHGAGRCEVARLVPRHSSRVDLGCSARHDSRRHWSDAHFRLAKSLWHLRSTYSDTCLDHIPGAHRRSDLRHHRRIDAAVYPAAVGAESSKRIGSVCGDARRCDRTHHLLHHRQYRHATSSTGLVLVRKLVICRVKLFQIATLAIFRPRRRALKLPQCAGMAWHPGVHPFLLRSLQRSLHVVGSLCRRHGKIRDHSPPPVLNPPVERLAQKNVNRRAYDARPCVCHRVHNQRSPTFPTLLMIVVAMPARQVLTNDTVIKMVKAKLDERVIVEKIRNSPGRYSLTTDSLVELSRQGWPEKVKLAMQAKQAAAPAETSTDNAPAPRR